LPNIDTLCYDSGIVKTSPTKCGVFLLLDDFFGFLREDQNSPLNLKPNKILSQHKTLGMGSTNKLGGGVLPSATLI